MEEFFKAVQFSHRLILTASAALMLFAFSPNPTDRYEAALAELSSLRSADFDEYIQTSIDVLALESWIEDPSCSDVESTSSQEHSLFSREYDGSDGDILRTILLFPIPDKKRDPIESFVHFFDRGMIFDFCITEKEIFSNFNKAIKNNNEFSKNVQNRSLIDVSLSFIDEKFTNKYNIGEQIYSIYYHELDSIGFNINSSTNDLIDLNYALENHKGIMSTNYSFSQGGDDGELDMNIQIEETIHASIADSVSLFWYTENETIESFEQIFINTFSILDELGNLTIEDSIRFLNRRITEDKSHPEIYGVKVDSTKATLIAPIALLALFLFFFGHVIGLKNEITRSKTLERFPSILLLPGRTAFLFAGLSSVILFPAASVIAFIYRVGDHGPLIWAIALSLIAITLLVGTISVVDLSKINQRIHS